MDITKHAIKRYAERIVGIKDELELNRYVTLNADMIICDMHKLYEHAILLYTGQIGTDKTTSNFYLRDDIILVGDSQKTRIYTLYRIDFDFPPETNKMVIRDLVSAIDALKEELTVARQEVDSYIEEKQFEVENIDVQIKNLKSQLEILDQQKKAAAADIDAKRSSLNGINKKIEGYANKLCNSLEFKRDLNANMIKQS